jgi:chemotaxis protein MotB
VQTKNNIRLKNIPVNFLAGVLIIILLGLSILVVDRLFLDGILTGQATNLPKMKVLMNQLEKERRKNLRLEEELRLMTIEMQEMNKEIEGKVATKDTMIVHQAPASMQKELKELKEANAFFETLRQTIGDNPDIMLKDGKFIFKDEVFFHTASTILTASAKQKLDKIATIIKRVAANLSDETPWIIKVEGHADQRKLKNKKPYSSNWILSSARAVSIVQYFIAKGIDPDHLYAAGFSHHQPDEKGNNPKVWRENRRSIIAFDRK